MNIIFSEYRNTETRNGNSNFELPKSEVSRIEFPRFFPHYKDEEPYTKELASDMVNDTASQPRLTPKKYINRV